MILNQPGLPGITKDESKAIASCHVTAETAAVCVIKSEIKKMKEKKKLKKPKKITADVSDSMFPEFSKLQISWHNTTSSLTHEST